MDPKQLRTVITNTLLGLDAAVGSHFVFSKSNAVELLLMTAAHESQLGKYLYQKPNGPAQGIFQMEGPTYADVWQKVIGPLGGTRREDLGGRCFKVLRYLEITRIPPVTRLQTDLRLAIVVARMQYWRFHEAVPEENDFSLLLKHKWIEALAQYAKKYWNTEKGKASLDDYYTAYMKLVDPPLRPWSEVIGDRSTPAC